MSLPIPSIHVKQNRPARSPSHSDLSHTRLASARIRPFSQLSDDKSPFMWRGRFLVPPPSDYIILSAMKKSFEFTQREIDDDVRAHVSRVFHQARSVITQFILPNAEIRSPSIEETTSSPLAVMIRDVLEHAAGMREVTDVAATCQRLLRILHGKTLAQEGEVPSSFWSTPVGAAIHECS